jgi:hypothetical protein
MADAASALLFGDDDDWSRTAVAFLERLFRDIIGVREDTVDPRDHSALLVPAGSSSSPLDAARCLPDVRRTAIYLRGVHGAIKEAQLRFPGEIIHILYAGCGPFATLCLPLLPLLTGKAVHFTLLDVHARAVESVQAILTALQLDGVKVDCLVCDATNAGQMANIMLDVKNGEIRKATLNGLFLLESPCWPSMITMLGGKIL